MGASAECGKVQPERRGCGLPTDVVGVVVVRWSILPAMPAERIRHVWRVVAAVGAAAILSVLVAGADRSANQRSNLARRHFMGTASLPLSGDLGLAGTAFREGFSAGLDSAPDSLFDWSWKWIDNEGDPIQAQAFVSASTEGTFADLLLVGMSTAAVGLPTCPKACLVLDDGGMHPPDPRRWDLWTPSTVQRNRLLRILRGSPPPRTVVVEATGPWTEPVFPALSDSLPDLQMILHDAENSRWEDAVSQILAQRPKTVLFWDAPAEASSLLARRLVWPSLRSAVVWVPEGTIGPPWLHADTLRPLWQVVPGSSSGSWKDWGWRCGRALAQASRRRVLDTLPDWKSALALVPEDSTLQSSATGWYPVEH